MPLPLGLSYKNWKASYKRPATLVIMTLLASPPTPDPPSNSDKPWLQHLTLLVGLTSVAFIAIRLLSVSAGNPETAYAILQAEGTGSVIVGSLISWVGLIAAPVGIFAFWYLGVLGSRSRDSATALWQDTASVSLGIFVLAVIISYFTTPVISFLVITGSWLFTCLVVLAVNVFTQRRAVKKVGFREKLPSIWTMAVLYLGLALVLLAVYGNPWVPPQNIVLRGHPAFSAYILSQTSDTTVILTRDHKLVRQIKTGQIISQEICQPPRYSLDQETLSQFLNSSKGSYPRCAHDYHS